MIKDLYDVFKSSKGVSIDSRSILPGQIFFALKGPNFDGHQYIDVALDKGASIAVIQDDSYSRGNKTFKVENVEASLQHLAMFHRANLTIPVLGLTGSNGKTTTKELLNAVLAQKFSVFATKGNLNNHLGVPLSILSIDDTHDIAIIEMGANHIGEIKFLSEIAMPTHGVITNIGKAHLEGFGNIEGVRKGKTELYDYIERANGILFYNGEDELLVKSLGDRDVKKFIYSSKDIMMEKSFPFLHFYYKEILIESNLSGRYNIYNMIVAIKLGAYFGVDLEKIKIGLERYIPENNRSQILDTSKNRLIMDAYNANPSSMKVSIENLAMSDSKNKTLIVGKMLELGESETEEHKNLVDYISQFDWQDVFLVGGEFPKTEKYTSFKTTDEAIEFFKNANLIDHTILIKGSRGAALEKIVPYL